MDPLFQIFRSLAQLKQRIPQHGCMLQNVILVGGRNGVLLRDNWKGFHTLDSTCSNWKLKRNKTL